MNNIFNKKTKQEISAHITENKNKIHTSMDDVCFKEGYEHVDDGLVPKYGARWADEFTFLAIYHEIAHAIEIVDTDPERLFFPFFGMQTTTQIEIFGRFYDNCITTQATERECRVHAIQAKLMANVFNLDEKEVLDYILEDSVSALYLMHDFLNIKTPLNIDKKKEKDKYRMDWIRNEVVNYHKNLDIDDIYKKLKEIKKFRNIDDWSLDQLDEYSYHNVDVEQLKSLCNPLSSWAEQEKPLTEEEITKSDLEALLGETPLWSEIDLNNTSEIEKNRARHIQKIKYFIENKHKKPIDIDVGIPDMGCVIDHIITDGNHRFSADVITKTKIVKAKIMGSESYAKELGLWCPNIFMEKIEEIYKKKHSDIYQEKINKLITVIKKDKISNSKSIIDRESFNLYNNIHDYFLYNKEELNESESFIKDLVIEDLGKSLNSNKFSVSFDNKYFSKKIKSNPHL